MLKSKKKKLQKLSLNIKLKILETIFRVKKGHIGGTYSVLDILVYLFFSNTFKLDKKNFRSKNNDVVVLSKGHAALAIYSVLYEKKISKHYNYNYFNKKNRSLLEHPTVTKNTPELIFDTGSLGHSLGVCAGMAFANKINSAKKKLIAILGDGELYEGSNWESLMFIAHYKLNNLLVIIDRNELITLDKTEQVIKLESLKKKFSSFNFDVKEINGHDYNQLEKNISLFKRNKKIKPMVIICNTIKGKGVSLFEKNLKFHHAVPSTNEFNKAKVELKQKIENL